MKNILYFGTQGECMAYMIKSKSAMMSQVIQTEFVQEYAFGGDD